MTVLSKPTSGNDRSRSLILILGGLAIVGIIVAAASAAFSLREGTRREWTAQMSSLSLTLAEQAAQTLFSAHTVLNSLTDVVRQARLEDAAAYRAFVSAETRHRVLVDKTSANPIIDVATFVANDGEVLNFTRSFPPAQINLSERDYFKAHSADPGLDVYTSVPVRNKGNGKWVFYISRRINNSQGEMLGLILVGVSVEVFSKFYERVGSNLGDGASLSLYRNDFTLMTRWPFVDDLIGKQNLQSATKSVIGDLKRTHDVVITAAPRLTSGNAPVSRMAAPRTVDRFPFIVTPVVTEELYLRNWRESVLWISATALFSVILVALGMRALLRADRKVREELAERIQAQTSLREAHEQLEARVVERTAALTREIEERELAQRELAGVNSRIAAVSHRAGMAEVANSVLHNVGNVLNSVNVSVSVLGDRLKRTPMTDFPKAVAMIREHPDDLGAFLTQDEQGRQLPVFLGLLADQWSAEHRLMQAESDRLRSSVQSIKDIVTRQQSLSGESGISGPVEVVELVEDALAIHAVAIERSQVKIVRDIEGVKTWVGDRSKLAQIILNLVVNAEEAIAAAENPERLLTISAHTEPEGTLVIGVRDTGIGIDPAAFAKLFSYGFTTKPKGHGFGLHASALAAQQMGGELRATSEGLQRGACFELRLPDGRLTAGVAP